MTTATIEPIKPERETWIESLNAPAFAIAPPKASPSPGGESRLPAVGPAKAGGEGGPTRHITDTQLDVAIAVAEIRVAKLKKLAALRAEECQLKCQIKTIVPAESEYNKAVEMILEKTAAAFDIRLEELLHKDRRPFYTAARFTAWAMLREFTELSSVAIGEIFSGRDHTAILYGVRTVLGWLPGDQVLQRKIDVLRSEIQSAIVGQASCLSAEVSP
jgi:hypothetical protein